MKYSLVVAALLSVNSAHKLNLTYDPPHEPLADPLHAHKVNRI